MNAPDLCDVCGSEVAGDEGVRAEMTVAGAMCPTPMVMHPACYERAKDMWQPDDDSLCSVDPLFPETTQWSAPQPEAAGH